MQITLEKNSWHFKYYSWCLSDTAPRSLCPYFWSLVFLIACSPIIILVKFTMWLSAVSEKKKEKERKEKMAKVTDWDAFYEKEIQALERKNRIVERSGKIFFGVFIAAVVIVLITGFAYAVMLHGWREILIKIGIAIVIGAFLSGVILGSAYAFPKLFEWISERSIVKMIRGMIGAYYEKACPLINWQGSSVGEENLSKN